MAGPVCYVAGGLATMLRVSRLGGIAPLKFVKKGSGWSVSLSPGWTYYGYFIVTIIIIISLGCLIVDLQLPQDKSVHMKTSTRRAVWVIDLSCMLLIAGTSVFGAPSQMRTMIACLNRIEKINFQLNIRNWPVHSEGKKIRFFLSWMIATVILNLVDLLMEMSGSKMNETQKWLSIIYSFYYGCYWILQLRELNFVMITLHVMYCLRSINDSLKTLLRELADSNELPFITLFNGNLSKATRKKLFKVNIHITADSRKARSEGHRDTVRCLALAYATTCDVVRELDAAHGFIVLMMLGSFLLHLVCTPYYVIKCIIRQSSLETDWLSAIYVVVQLVWCFYHTVDLLMIIEPCHLTQIEMETTYELVSHLIRCTDSTHDPLAMELDMFFKHLFLNQTSYTAMRVTTISRSLVATILGSITTYLVIIIQL